MRISRVAFPNLAYMSATHSCNYSVAIRVNRVMLVSLCAETIKPVSEGGKIGQLWKEMHLFIESIL